MSQIKKSSPKNSLKTSQKVPRKTPKKKLVKKNIDSLESLNTQIAKLKISLEVTESMRDIAQAKFDKQNTIKPKIKKSIKRELLS